MVGREGGKNVVPATEKIGSEHVLYVAFYLKNVVQFGFKNLGLNMRVKGEVLKQC